MFDNVSIIDYGHGNLGSILNMINRIGGSATLVSDPKNLASARKIILPGIGAFDSGMNALQNRGFIEVLLKKVTEEGAPLLGICLGMQMLGDFSEEGVSKGLGLIDGGCVRFRNTSNDPKLKIPQIGWNEVLPTKDSKLLCNIDATPRFYFVHSYHFVCQNEADIAATSEFGGSFVAAVERKNIFGVQFHPEKSHRFGMKLIQNFLELPC